MDPLSLGGLLVPVCCVLVLAAGADSLCVIVFPCPLLFSPSMLNQTTCSLGAFCPSGSVAESDCPLGKFCQTPALAEDCPIGRYGSSTRLTAAAQCTACPNGMRGLAAGQSTQAAACGPCTLGSYCIAGVQTACSYGAYCPPNTSTVEPPCPQGSYCGSPSSRVDCPTGRWGPSTGLLWESQCTFCAAGKFGAADGAQSEPTGCADCPLGSWSSMLGLSDIDSCTSCGFGSVGLAAGQSSYAAGCKYCAAGFYCLGTSDPVSCSDGSYCPPGTTTVNPPCPQGSYCTTPSEVEACPQGRYGDATGLTLCTACGAGKYGTVTGATSEAAACVPCTAAPGTGLSCPPGSTTDSPPCPRGFYCPDASTILGCPLGSFGEWTGFSSATSCTACSVGRYTALTGQSSEEAACPGCPAGRWSGALLSSVTGCIECAVEKVGTFSGQMNESAACAAPCAATRTAPVNGAMAHCGTADGDAYACWPVCRPYYALSGQSTCTANAFTPATCQVCSAGQFYTLHATAVIARFQESGAPGFQQQGGSVSISADGSIMVQAAGIDNQNQGGQFMRRQYRARRGALSRKEGNGHMLIHLPCECV
jgi:hypothetical protein